MTLKMLLTPIKAVLGFPKLSPKDLLASATAIHTGMNGNPAYPNPPVDMAALKADIDNFLSAITAADSRRRRLHVRALKDCRIPSAASKPARIAANSW